MIGWQPYSTHIKTLDSQSQKQGEICFPTAYWEAGNQGEKNQAEKQGSKEKEKSGWEAGETKDFQKEREKQGKPKIPRKRGKAGAEERENMKEGERGGEA